MLALLEIAVVLCSMLFVTLPATAIAAEEDDYVLGIYGNANEDDTIDMRDLTYVKLIFFGKKPEKELADAKYDGKINPLDFIQIKLIIVGKEKELTVVDSADRTVTVSMPVERIIPMVTWSYEPVWILEAQDKVVGVTTDAKQREDVYSWLPGILDKPTIGTYRELDYEKVLEVNPDIVIVGGGKVEEQEEKLAPAGITVLVLHFKSQEKFANEFTILAKILGKDDKAEEFLSWKQSYLDWIKEKTEGMEPKVRVYTNWCGYPWLSASEGSGIHDVITMAGGYNIASGLPGPYPWVESEWVLRENPEVIIIGATGCSVPPTGYFMDSDEEAKRLVEETCNTTGLKETAAVENGGVYVLNGYLMETVRGYIGAYYCARWFYPQEFADLNPEEIHREYFEEWLDVPYQGIWVYPPLD